MFGDHYHDEYQGEENDSMSDEFIYISINGISKFENGEGEDVFLLSDNNKIDYH